MPIFGDDGIAAAAIAAGKDVTVLVGTGYNHFEFPETHGNPYGPSLGRATLDLMGLEPNQCKKKQKRRG